MKHLVKKKKNILLGILFIAIIVCTPFLFGEEGCDDGLNEVTNSVNDNKKQMGVDFSKYAALDDDYTIKC